jgi:putative hydrolase of the HAD superfamily
MRIKVVALDMDDTLFDERDYVISGFHAVAAHLGEPRFTDAACQIFAGGERARVFDRALEQIGISSDPTVITECLAAYRSHHPTIKLRDDAEWLFEHLAPSMGLALITDGYLQTQRLKLAALGVAGRFDCLIFTDELGREHWKPSALPYRKVCEALQTAPAECVYIGDNPAKDFVRAKELGWLTVQVSREEGIHRDLAPPASHRAHHEVATLSDLPGIDALAHAFSRISIS